MFSFELPKIFVDGYRSRPVPFGWNGLGKVTFYRTYSRTDNPRVDGQEAWVDVCERVINGMYTIQKNNVPDRRWNNEKAMASAMEAFDLMFNFRWTPPGRGLWMMGTPFIHERGEYAALQNCGYASTQDIATEGGNIFRWFMEKLMLGVGVGFDTRGAGKGKVIAPAGEFEYIINDDRESWAQSVAVLIDSYLYGGPAPIFDYSLVRPKGVPIRGFGGVASGPEPLMHLHREIAVRLNLNIGKPITSTTITDIFNLIGACVVAGNVRRSAEIALGSPFDTDFINLKNYSLNLHRAEYGWTSNNSVMIEDGMDVDYRALAQRTYDNGEPGYYWIDNARNYGRMNGVYEPDLSVMGANPCVTADTVIDTSDGRKQVKDLIGVPFYAELHGWNYYSAGFWKTGTKPVFKLHTMDGRKLRLTEDHKVLAKTAHNPNEKWIMAKDLCEGDLIATNDDLGGYVGFWKLIEDGVEDVYDCTVNIAHRFSANGLIVHNCLEQVLGDKEMCTLSEIHLPNCNTKQEFVRAIKYAYLYGKTATLLSPHLDDESADIMSQNRRIGLSITGHTQFIGKHGMEVWQDWLDHGYHMVAGYYDKLYSQWMDVPVSVRKTSVKPSGTISLVSGVTPGIHYNVASRYHIRRLTLSSDSKILASLQRAGYPIEESVYSRDSYVVEFPVDAGPGVKSESEVSMWDQLTLIQKAQELWADNAVSATVKFDRNQVSVGDLAEAIEWSSTRLKGISFLPQEDHGYAQAPYESIDRERYYEMMEKIDVAAVDGVIGNDKMMDMYCDGEACVIPPSRNSVKVIAGNKVYTVSTNKTSE